ncbi:MAG: hypothetical protein COA62_13180 [Rhodobiaceae bacterium]|nr:MAG: hypothetical protein COA62_13180 [Rhodobiaceae bacterium]
MAVAATATAELPLYLQMSRYTRGSKAVMELRTERYLAEQQAQAQLQASATDTTKINTPSDDELITGSIGSNDDNDGLSFDDLLDAINPLQHLPVISTLYREITGDEIRPAARIVGGAIFGGPVGAGFAIAEAVLEEASGEDTGGHIMALLNGEKSRNTATPEQGPDLVAPAPETIAAAPQLAMPENPHATTTPFIAGNLPSLSPEAFAALLTISPPRTTAGQDPSGAGLVSTDLSSPGDISAAMNSALDMYNALQAQERR